jgi:hypothetical protein
VGGHRSEGLPRGCPGNTAKALEWLARAVRLPDAGVVYVKTDALMDPLRSDPRFQAIERELRFPD